MIANQFSLETQFSACTAQILRKTIALLVALLVWMIVAHAQVPSDEHPGDPQAKVIDGVVGDYLCAKFGDLKQTPLTIRVKGNRLTEAYSDNKELEQDFWAYTHTDDNSDRVGEFAIGTNIELKDVIGHILQDEKFPGIHIAFGNPYGEHTGAKWYSSTHIDVVGRRFDIWVDDQQIMREGKFLMEA